MARHRRQRWADDDDPGRRGCACARRSCWRRRVLAGGELPDGRPDLPARQRAAPRAAAPGAHQAPAAGPLGHVAGPEPALRPPQPAHPRARRQRHLRRRARPRRPGDAGQRLPRGHLLGGLPRHHPGRPGIHRLFRQFSTPGGIPSHVSVPTPGSIHEGGELGYALVHAFGAAFDNPDLVAACVVGDGEAETGPLAGSWKGINFLNPVARRRGAADPAPQRLQDLRARRCSAASSTTTIASPAHRPRLRPPLRRGRRPGGRPRACWPPPSTPASTPSRPSRPRPAAAASRSGRAGRRSCCARRRAGPGPRWSTACRSRARSARTRCRWPTCGTTPTTCACSKQWMRSYRPEELFDEQGRPGGRAAGALAPRRRPPDGRQPPRQRRRPAPAARPARLHRLRACPCREPAAELHESTRRSALMLRDVFMRNRGAGQLPPLLPRRDQLQPAGRGVRGREPLPRSSRSCADRRPRGARRPGDGGPERAQLPGLARGLPAHRPPRAVRHLRGVRHGLGVDDRAARQVAARRRGRCTGARRSPRSTSCSPRPAGATTTTASATRARA